MPLVLALTALLAGCGGSQQPAAGHRAGTAPRPSAKAAGPARFLHVDALHRAVGLTLIAGDGAGNNGFNFDGYGRGELLVRVPKGWRMTVNCRNAGSQPNSCVVVSGPGAVTPAFPGATTPAPVIGLRSGTSSTFSFVPTRVGSYRLASLVTGHEQARMWDVLEVTPSGRPSIVARSGPS